METDVQPPLAGGLTPEKETLLTPRDFQVWDRDESALTPPVTDQTDGLIINVLVKSPNMVQLARERLRRSFDESRDADRVYDIVITHLGRSEARAGGSDDVVGGYWL